MSFLFFKKTRLTPSFASCLRREFDGPLTYGMQIVSHVFSASLFLSVFLGSYVKVIRCNILLMIPNCSTLGLFDENVEYFRVFEYFLYLLTVEMPSDKGSNQ